MFTVKCLIHFLEFSGKNYNAASHLVDRFLKNQEYGRKLDNKIALIFD